MTSTGYEVAVRRTRRATPDGHNPPAPRTTTSGWSCPARGGVFSTYRSAPVTRRRDRLTRGAGIAVRSARMTFTGSRAIRVSSRGATVDWTCSPAADVDDTLLHFWSEGWDEGSESLGGILSGDPVAVALGPRRLHVFARGSGGALARMPGGHLLHWWWSEPQGRMTGPERSRAGGSCTTRSPSWPALKRSTSTCAARATSCAGWRMKADILGRAGVPRDGGERRARRDLRGRGPGRVRGLDPMTASSTTGSSTAREVPKVWEEADGGYDGGAVIGTPAAVWTPSPHRFDVVGRTGDGSMLAHWGWSRSENPHAEPDVGIDHPGHWFGPGDRDSYAPLGRPLPRGPGHGGAGGQTPRGVRPRQADGAAAVVMGRRVLVTVPLLARTHAGRAQRTRVALRLQSGRAAPWRGPDRAVRVGRRQGGGREREREAAAAARPEDVDVRHRRASSGCGSRSGSSTRASTCSRQGSTACTRSSITSSCAPPISSCSASAGRATKLRPGDPIALHRTGPGAEAVRDRPRPSTSAR